MIVDWVQTRRIVMGATAGLVIGGVVFPLLWPTTVDRLVTETIEVEKKVEVVKEVEVIKELTKEIEKKVYITQQGKEKETIWLPSGEIRLIERESLVTKDSTVTQTEIGKELTKEKETSVTQEQSKTAKTTVQDARPSYGLGLAVNLRLPFQPTIEDVTLTGKASIGGSPFWVVGGYSYPIKFSLGVEYVF